MRIGIVLAKTPAYSETFFISKIKGLQQQGHEVTLFVQQAASNFDLCPIRVAPKVTTIPLLQAFKMLSVFLSLLPHTQKVLRCIREDKQKGIERSKTIKKLYLNAEILKASLDWLHFGFTTLAIGRESLAKNIGAKMAVSFRGFDINVYPLKNPNCYQEVWKSVDKIHSISEYLVLRAYELGLSKDIPYQIITPAVTIDELPEPINVGKGDKLIITTIARLNWIKGIDVALSAMKVLKDSGVFFEYRIIGAGKGNEAERYKFQVHTNQLEAEVHFLGQKSHDETKILLAETHIYVQPSLNEGFCNAVLEAQALGKMVIASNTGGLPENILENKTGFLFESGNSDALAHKIIEVIGLPLDKKNTIQIAAKERVRRSFNIKKQQQEFASFYTELL